MTAAARRLGPGPIWHPGNPYPSIWERIAKFGKRKNSASGKPQGQKIRSKGGRRKRKPKPDGKGGWK